MVPWEVVLWTLAELGLFAHFEHLPALSNTFSFKKTYYKHQRPLQPSIPYHPHTLFTQVVVLSSLSTHSPTAPLTSTTKLLQTTISASNCNVWYGITQSPCSEIWTHSSPFSLMLYILVPLYVFKPPTLYQDTKGRLYPDSNSDTRNCRGTVGISYATHVASTNQYLS